jgi:hypothetical protein
MNSQTLDLPVDLADGMQPALLLAFAGGRCSEK